MAEEDKEDKDTDHFFVLNNNWATVLYTSNWAGDGAGLGYQVPYPFLSLRILKILFENESLCQWSMGLLYATAPGPRRVVIVPGFLFIY